jgi:small subunit ribosomal protein S17e
MLLERYPDLFTSDFEENKQTLARVAVIRSKQFRNELAGYITALVQQETEEPEEPTPAAPAPAPAAVAPAAATA